MAAKRYNYSYTNPVTFIRGGLTIGVPSTALAVPASLAPRYLVEQPLLRRKTRFAATLQTLVDVTVAPAAPV